MPLCYNFPIFLNTMNDEEKIVKPAKGGGFSLSPKIIIVVLIAVFLIIAAGSSFFVVDDEGRKIESSKENPGLLAVSGRMMMNGYFGSEELTKATLKDGVLYTSDLGYIDEAGRIYVLGRKDDVINYKGIKIAPEEIEQPASKYPGVKDCCCVPVEDAVCGQVPKLYVLPASADQFDKKAFLEYLKKNLEPGRMPASVELIDQIPRSSNGKLQRKKLRER